MKNPSQNQIHELEKHVARADKIAADAARWGSLLETAQASRLAAQNAFLDTLDAKGAATLAEADADVHKLTLAVGTVEAAGGPNALRLAALETPEAFALFAAGFEARFNALGAMKRTALRALATSRAEATEAGEINPLAVEELPAVREASDKVARIDAEAQAALTAHNYAAARRKGQSVTYRPFDELLSLLRAPLPAVPDLAPAPASAVGKW
jgi:hypothetical protein